MGIMDGIKDDMAKEMKKEMLPIIEEMQKLRKSIDKLSSAMEENNKLLRK